jgi:hypothetical protein
MTIGASGHKVQIALVAKRQVGTIIGLQGEALQIGISNTCVLEALIDCPEFDKVVLKPGLVISVVPVKPGQHLSRQTKL